MKKEIIIEIITDIINHLSDDLNQLNESKELNDFDFTHIDNLIDEVNEQSENFNYSKFDIKNVLKEYFN